MPVQDDIFFPTNIRLESSSRLHDEVTELFTPGGLRTVINRREEPLTALQVSYIGDTAAAKTLYDIIFAMRRGQAVLARNWSLWNTSANQDNADSVTNLDMQLYNPTDGDYEGDGSTTVFQLEVQSSPGAALTQTKRIRKPNVLSVSGVGADVVIADNGSPAGAFTVNAANGEITFSVAPADGNTMTWGGEWWLPVYSAADDLAVESLIGHSVTATEGLLFMEEVIA